MTNLTSARKAIAAGIVLATIALTASPAAASPFTLVAKGQILSGGVQPGTLNISMECAAVLPLGSITNVSCYLRGADGSIHRPADSQAAHETGRDAGTYATAGVFESIKAQAYEVCIEAQGIQALESWSDSLCE
jgi:hypothetical protein